MDLRRVLPYTTVALLAVGLYSAWTFYARYSASQESIQRAKEAEARAVQQIVDRYGGGKLKILNFSVSPPQASPGERVLVCYSVANATEVLLDPPLEPIKPSVSRCLEAHPQRTTTYKFTARDASGAQVMAEATVTIL